MLDWLTIHVPIRHSRAVTAGDLFIWCNPDGEVLKEYAGPRNLAGSWDSRVRVSTVAVDESGEWGTVLRIDGNPAKWLQGHNLDGPESVDFLLAFCESVCSSLGLGAIRQDDWLQSEIYRLDLTRSWELGCERDVIDWIHAAERSVTLSHRGHGNMSKGSTLYWGKHSRRWSIKVYPKGRELRGSGRKPKLNRETAKAMAWAAKLLRVECVIRRLHLVDLKLSRVSDWTDERFEKVFENHVQKLNVADRVMPRWDQVEGLTASQRLAVQAWADGHRLQSLLPRASFYRLRRKILDEVGVDVASPAPEGGEVVPLLRPLRAEPAEVPEFLEERLWRRSRRLVSIPLAA